MSHDLTFDNAAKAYELETKRIEVLSAARLSDLKAASVSEHIANQRLTNIAKARSLQEFEASLNRFRTRQAEFDRRARRLFTAGRSLAKYSLADRMSGGERQDCWAGYRVLFGIAPFSVVSSWATVPFRQTEADARYWVAKWISGRDSGDNGPAGDEIENVADLMAWQDRHHRTCVVRFGSPPHLAALKALSRLADAWTDECSRLESEISEIKSGTYSLWKPHEVFRLEDHPVS